MIVLLNHDKGSPQKSEPKDVFHNCIVLDLIEKDMQIIQNETNMMPSLQVFTKT
jgi:hypothetical protein